MVLAKLLAEMTVLVVLLCLPILVIFGGQLPFLSLPLQGLSYALSIVAFLALPCYLTMTWCVIVDKDGLSTFALCKRQHLPWPALEDLRLKTNLFGRQYVVQSNQGELTFPIWLENQKELLDCIRSYLPPGRAKSKGVLVFRQATSYLVAQFLKVVLSWVFVVVFWVFYAYSHVSGKANQGDLILLFGVGLCATGIFAWRAWVVLLMPRYVELGEAEITVGTCFFKRQIPWAKSMSITPSNFLLPEGMIFKTASGTYLIANDSDGADELLEAIQEKLSKDTKQGQLD